MCWKWATNWTNDSANPMISALHVPCVLAADVVGNPIAWLGAIGWIGGMILGFLAGRAKAMDEAKRMPPDEILAEIKKREFRVTVASLVGLPLFGLAIVLGAILHPLFFGFFLFLTSFQGMYFVELQQACPVCGTRLVYGYHKRHKVCPNCGARLELGDELDE